MTNGRFAELDKIQNELPQKTADWAIKNGWEICDAVVDDAPPKITVIGESKH